ncbi:molybdopterin-guanine dinucleotide biosynthesis protein B [Clostridium estertheticum]|uniref:molybdopterin-guanine dinucleotide biosynthesis protein B n=1 Tax=Clostridium estertheticum TaxID=238834 RepID=UPI001C0DAD09|nr:molybdopterin-guanine dinucleotide biosynthesis protein B [Clostridium estertheticum]MBU3073629.1 molybdopterin-guanine dinucleotide biosynthesis protein B [Clostridium estertheticum]MBU3163722.1 molybdopterin-guanine dinucleotide biosynthesis protein B [Clostridium estertheticum]MBU3186392.1 molybdopterin-guanine dinucleotide biosynthesis protein B [Clostridium estertheticum]
MVNSFSDKNKETLVLSIVAIKSNTGKTTLIEKLIKALKLRNYSVGVLKHDAHKFDIDKEGKDSFKFSAAGADNVIISSCEKLAMIHKVEKEVPIDEILLLFKEIDIVLIEGYKDNNFPKIEVHRKDGDSNLLCTNPKFEFSKIIAIATDEDVNVNIPILNLNDVNSICDFIESKLIEEN